MSEVQIWPGAPLHPTRRVVTMDLYSVRLPGSREFAYDAVPDIGPRGAMTYAEYLQTPEWREYRAAVIVRQGGVCTMCPRRVAHCHHRTYANLGWEADDDCVGVCRPCHEKHHGKASRRGRP